MARPAPILAPLATEPSETPPEDLRARLRPPGRRRFAWIAGGLVLAALIGAAWFGSGGGEEAALETVSPTRGELTRRVTAVGQLEPVDSVEVGSDLGGKVIEVAVEDNQRVVAGQVLARLDPTPFENEVTRLRASVASSRAQLQKAQVELERAQRDRDRVARLAERGAASEVDVADAVSTADAARASVAVARAALDQAGASLAVAEQDLQETVVRSPIDGVVLQRLVEQGQTVVSAMSATALFEVASDLTTLEVEVAVDEADVGGVRVGQAATFTVSAWPERTFAATVEAVDLAADPDADVVVYGADLRVDNADGSLRPGMTATAVIVTDTLPDVWLVPGRALRYRPAGPGEQAPAGDHVTVLGEDGATTPMAVTVLGSDGATTALAGDGLTADLRVVVGGAR